MYKTKWNDAWQFWPDKGSFALVWNIPDNARTIDLPHDAMIEKPANPDSLNGTNTGYRDGEVIVYVKHLYAPEAYRSRTITLKFEGVYMNAFVYVNGQLAAKSPFGYTSFYAELNDLLKYGQDNEIRVQVRAGAMTNSRWYSGAGIYRDTYLLEAGLTYIADEGVRIRTENADEGLAVLLIETELKNRQPVPSDLVLVTEIRDAYGNTVASETTPVVVFGQEARTLTQRVTVQNPKLWSAETPNLYTCASSLYTRGNDGGLTLIDEHGDKFGIRTLQVDAKRGLRVNNQSVNLRGACIHHDSGLLGAATYEGAQQRQVKKLKAAGFNAIRMAHHPMAPAMLRACDEIGLYVMDETFDMWTRCKSDYDYGLYFQEWWEKDVTAMVRKDFNHPSVILYSVGNEIPEIGNDLGAKTCQAITEKIKSLDSTRFTLASINGVFAAGDAVDQIVADVAAGIQDQGQVDGHVNDFLTLMDKHMDEIVLHPAISDRLEKACACTDIAGYNYMTARYEPDGSRYTNRVIVGSETYPPEIARNWKLVEQLPSVIGDFTWTGWDYLGEAGVGIPAYQRGEGGFGAVFPAQIAYCGDIDITGFRRPASYFREIVFGLRQAPYIAVQNPHKYGQPLIKTPWVISDAISSWSWQGCEGRPVVAEVYAPGTEVELVLNNQSLGRQPSGEASGYRALFEITYEPGLLEAIAYDSGEVVGRFVLKTAGEDRKLVLLPEDQPAIDQNLLYIQAAIQDGAGTVATDCDEKITLTVEGGAAAIGFGSGNPKPDCTFNEGVTDTWHGLAQIILKRTSEAQVKVKVKSQSGLQAEAVL